MHLLARQVAALQKGFLKRFSEWNLVSVSLDITRSGLLGNRLRQTIHNLQLGKCRDCDSFTFVSSYDVCGVCALLHRHFLPVLLRTVSLMKVGVPRLSLFADVVFMASSAIR